MSRKKFSYSEEIAKVLQLYIDLYGLFSILFVLGYDSSLIILYSLYEKNIQIVFFPNTVFIQIVFEFKKTGQYGFQ